MNETFLTADTHFGHSNIIRHAHRPFNSIEEHDEFIIKQWNQTVNKGDTVYILGDFAWKQHNHYLMALNGSKILIKGSHDKMNIDCLRNFSEVHNGMLIKAINKVRFIMTHCAMLVWEGSHYNSINCHGHSHQRLEERDDVRRMDVGVDGSPDYRPLNVNFIIYKMSLKKKKEYNRSDDELRKIVENNRSNNEILLTKWNEINKNEKV